MNEGLHCGMCCISLCVMPRGRGAVRHATWKRASDELASSHVLRDVREAETFPAVVERSIRSIPSDI